MQQVSFFLCPVSFAFGGDVLGSGLGEHNYKVSAVITLVAVDVAHTEFGVIGAEDIGSMWRAIHPPVKRGLWVLRDHVVLPDP